MTEVEAYLEQVKSFNRVTPEAANQLLEEQAGHIVFIGRETCGYCRKFVATLSEVAQDKNLTINYVHAQDPDYADSIQEFRIKYNIPTVPGFLYSDANQLKVKCDSSLTKEAIAAFVNA